MAAALQLHGDADWPECWCYYPRSDANVPGQKLSGEGVACGAFVVFERGRLTYRCPQPGCAPFTREPGFDNEAARAWVDEHRPHLWRET
jgi:hypothetical protein